jgi:hypothetical protein
LDGWVLPRCSGSECYSIWIAVGSHATKTRCRGRLCLAHNLEHHWCFQSYSQPQHVVLLHASNARLVRRRHRLGQHEHSRPRIRTRSSEDSRVQRHGSNGTLRFLARCDSRWCTHCSPGMDLWIERNPLCSLRDCCLLYQSTSAAGCRYCWIGCADDSRFRLEGCSLGHEWMRVPSLWFDARVSHSRFV